VGGPVPQLVQGGVVVIGRAGEDVLQRQADDVRAGAAVVAVGLVVADIRARILRAALAGFDHLPGLVPLWLVLRHAIDLLGVEYDVYPVYGVALVMVFLFTSVWLAVIEDRPELDLRAVLALADLPALLLRLVEGQPAGIVVAEPDGMGDQPDGIAAALKVEAGGVE